MSPKRKRLESITVDEIEDFALFIGLAAVFVIELIRIRFPNFFSFYSQNPTPFYIATFLLAFRFLVKKITEVRQALELGSPMSADFNEQVRRLIKNHPQSRNVDILATNKRKFYHAVEDLSFHADKIRILIYEQSEELDVIVQSWKGLQEKGVCHTLEIKTYDITLSFYGILVDSRVGCFGFFDPKYIYDPSVKLGLRQITGPYMLSSHNPLGQAILTDTKQWFEQIFECHAKPLYPPN